MSLKREDTLRFLEEIHCDKAVEPFAGKLRSTQMNETQMNEVSDD